MGFVLLGCILAGLKLFELGPVALWSWWWVLSPFAGAVVWWTIADLTGYTRRKAMERESRRVADRRDRHLKAMGLDLFDRKSRRRSPKDGSSNGGR